MESHPILDYVNGKPGGQAGTLTIETRKEPYSIAIGYVTVRGDEREPLFHEGSWQLASEWLLSKCGADM